MLLSFPSGLWILVLLPVALVLEWLRRAARRKVVPALVLWEEVAREIGPPHRARRFDVGVAALVIAFASCALAASGGGVLMPGGTVRDVEIVMDRSAASLASLAEGRTRFDAQRAQVEALLQGLSDGDSARLSIEPGGLRADRRGAALLLLEHVEPCAEPAPSPPDSAGTPGGRTRWLVAPALDGDLAEGWIAWSPLGGMGNAGFVAGSVGEPDRGGRADLLVRIAFSGAPAPVTVSVEADGERVASAVLSPGPRDAASHLFPALPLGGRDRLVCRLIPGGSLVADDEIVFSPRHVPLAGYLGDVPAPVRAAIEAAGAEGVVLAEGPGSSSVDILVVSGVPVPPLPREGPPVALFLVGATGGRTPFASAGSAEDGEFLPGADDTLLRDVPRTPLRVRGEAALARAGVGGGGVEGIYLAAARTAAVARVWSAGRAWVHVGFLPDGETTSWIADTAFPVFWYNAVAWASGGAKRSWEGDPGNLLDERSTRRAGRVAPPGPAPPGPAPRGLADAAAVLAVAARPERKRIGIEGVLALLALGAFLLWAARLRG